MKTRLLVFLVALLLACPAYGTNLVVKRSGGAAGGGTISIGNNTGNSGGLQDNRLDTVGADNNHGAHLKGYCGSNGSGREMKELQRFDLSSIPAGATCVSAVLYLYDTDWANRSASLTINIYKVADANGDWIEGTATDATEAGSPCWNYKSYNTVSWAGSAGLSTAGTDYVNTSLGSATFTDGVSGYRTITLNADGRAALESWFGGTGGNGWILVGSGAGETWTEWQSRQGTDGQRPYISVTYTTP